MNKTKFQLGDKVQVDDSGVLKKDSVGIITAIDGETAYCYTVTGKDKAGIKEYDYYCDDDLKQIVITKTPLKPNFLLKFDAGREFSEEFETMKQVQARIKELSTRSDLQRDSLVIYEVKAKKVIKLSTTTRISIKAA